MGGKEKRRLNDFQRNLKLKGKFATFFLVLRGSCILSSKSNGFVKSTNKYHISIIQTAKFLVQVLNKQSSRLKIENFSFSSQLMIGTFLQYFNGSLYKRMTDIEMSKLLKRIKHLDLRDSRHIEKVKIRQFQYQILHDNYKALIIKL